MSERPLLIFPTPQLAERTKKSGWQSRNIHIPTLDRQRCRLLPLFTELQKSFEARKIDIRSNAIGTNPEDVLVIETIGDIENFANAVKRINGLEWMGEFESTDITPDDDFYDEENKQKELVGHLYLVMTNQQALQEMLSLWKRYQANPSMKFARGLTKFRTVFQNLRNIRRWNVQDRLIEFCLGK